MIDTSDLWMWGTGYGMGSHARITGECSEWSTSGSSSKIAGGQQLHPYNLHRSRKELRREDHPTSGYFSKIKVRIEYHWRIDRIPIMCSTSNISTTLMFINVLNSLYFNHC